MSKNDYYTVSEAAELLGRSVQTIYKWMHSDKLSAVKNPATGKYMVLKKDVSSLQEWA